MDGKRGVHECGCVDAVHEFCGLEKDGGSGAPGHHKPNVQFPIHLLHCVSSLLTFFRFPKVTWCVCVCVFVKEEKEDTAAPRHLPDPTRTPVPPLTTLLQVAAKQQQQLKQSRSSSTARRVSYHRHR